MHPIEQFLKQEKISIPLAELWVEPALQRLSSLCYLEHEGRVLLLCRNHEPFEGYWTAPGGKLETGEDPRMAIIREMEEETGLTIQNPQLQLIASELGEDLNYSWLVFIFRCTLFTGSLKDCNEGILQWIPFAEITQLKLTEVDCALIPYIFNSIRRYLAQIKFDQAHKVSFIKTLPM